MKRARTSEARTSEATHAPRLLDLAPEILGLVRVCLCVKDRIKFNLTSTRAKDSSLLSLGASLRHDNLARGQSELLSTLTTVAPLTAVALTMTQFMTLALSLPHTVDTVSLRADGFLTRAFVHILAGLPQLQTLTTERLDVIDVRLNLSLLSRLSSWTSSDDKWWDTSAQASSAQASSAQADNARALSRTESLHVLELHRPCEFIGSLCLGDFPRLRRLSFRARHSVNPKLFDVPGSLQELCVRGGLLSPKAAWQHNLEALEGKGISELVLSRCYVTRDVLVRLLLVRLRLRRLRVGLRIQTDYKGRAQDLFGWMPETVELVLHRRSSWRNFCSWLGRNRWDHTRSLTVLVQDMEDQEGRRPPVWQALANLHSVERLSLECEPTLELLECCGSWMPKLKRLSMLDPVTGEPCIVRPRRPEDETE